MSEEDDFKPRNYQEALREIAIKRNSIIYLPTGSGKTFIAVLVLKHLQQAGTKYSEGGKISFVVVNTVALVDQHAKCIEKRTNLTVGRYSGDMNLDFWPKSKWYEQFDKYNVFVMTIQILVNLKNQNFLDLNKVNLIVFDECHRGVNDQPMRQLCKSFEHLKEPPRILGLTATLLNGNCKPSRILEEVRSLEVTYHSQVATVDGLSQVSGYSTNPKEQVLNYLPYTTSAVENLAIRYLEDITDLLKQVSTNNDSMITCPKADLQPLGKDEGLKKLANTLKDIILNIETLGVFGGSKAVLAHIIQIERMKKHCDEANLHMILCKVQTDLCFVKQLLEDRMSGYSDVEKIFRFSSDKVLKLISIFETYQDMSGEELCALVFTKRRFTAKVVYYILDCLSKADDRFAFIKANFMVGYNSNPYNDTRENLFNMKKNREVLQMFDNKELNVLVASNVLEEGVDITTCSLVIKFDYPEEYRSYIQSKGRARFPTSLYFMMVEMGDHKKFMTRYSEFQETEDTLYKFLIGQNQMRSEPSERDINEMYQEDELPPYYVDGPNSAKVDMVSAISLLSSYCNCLPCDKYTILAPELFFRNKKMADGHVFVSVTIVLPTACPLVDPVTGPYMKNLKLAKRAAALRACELLHRVGELDDHLLPKKAQVKEEDVSFLFRHYPKVKEPMAGTNKNKRLHKKQIPRFIKGPITPDKTATLHIIELVPQFERREEINSATFYDVYTSNLCYGLITPRDVPTVCDFPIYVTLGTIQVTLKCNVAQIKLTEEDMEHVKEFNYLIFNDILRSLKEFLIFDGGKDAESMLLVPVDRSGKSIDFGVLRENKIVKCPWVELTSEEKLSLSVTSETYLRKIVSPWYRDMGKQMFIVLKVDYKQNAKSKFPKTDFGEDSASKKVKIADEESTSSLVKKSDDYLVTEVALNKTAKTTFPNEQFGTFEDYFKDKHDVRLLNPEQPLLYVKSLTTKKNFIKPQGVQAKRKKEKTYEDLEIYLIPELVVKQDFPSALWIQANLLPTIVSRLSFMFRLEEFRVGIAKATGMGRQVMPIKQPLELDEYLLDYEPHVEKPKPINVLVPEPKEHAPPPLISSMNVNKDYAKSMLEMEYPWKDTDEPKDLERDLDVTILDVDYYEKFIGNKLKENDALLKNEVPRKEQQRLALTYYKDYVEKPIALLEKSRVADGPELCLIYKAMTTAKANDIVNMERLETLGDSFLKLFVSIYIFLNFPTYNEGLSTSLKGRMVSNKSLYYLAVKKNIGGLMKANDLQIADWLPPGFKVPDLIKKRIDSKETSLASLYRVAIPQEEQKSGRLSAESNEMMRAEHSEEDPSEVGLINDMASFFKCNYIGDKVVADCVEALLGAYFATCGIMGGIKFVEWIGIIPPSDDDRDHFLNKPPKNPILNAKSTMADINYHIPDWQQIEQEILGYRFKNRAYLLQALTHASYTPNRITQSYEKLEFIGDAVLDFLITCHIYEACGNLDPGKLTDLRSALVNNNTFASLVVRCNLHKYLLMINTQLQAMVDRFSDYMESRRFEIDDEVLILLEEEDADAGLNLAEYIDVPKVLGDVFEALAGAVYLDSGKDLKTVWKVFYRIMWKEIEAFSANVPINLVRKLYERNPNPHPSFGAPVEVNKNKVMVPLQFMMNGRRQQVYGFGSNKYMAKKAAAKLALRQLK